MLKRFFFILIMAGLISGYGGSGNAITISYTAYDHITGLPTGQTATADFNLISGNQLQIILTETTPAIASSLTGAGAILTSIGFLLPNGVTIVPASSGVVINTGGTGYLGGTTYGGGYDVSGEWGATVGKLNINTNMGAWDFVSSNGAQVTQFNGTNLDGPAVLDGPQGGLLLDPSAAGGLGYINNSVIITVSLSGTVSGDWLAGLNAQNTIIEYGSNEAFSRVPEPGTLLLLGAGLFGLAMFARRRK